MPEFCPPANPPAILVGTGNSLLIRDQLTSLSEDLILNLQSDVTSIEAISGLFSASHPARLRPGHTLILDCFANDVRLAHREGFSPESLEQAFEQLCQWLLSTDRVSRLVQINLWPAALKTPPLLTLAQQISCQRQRTLNNLAPRLPCRMIEIGRDSTDFDASDHPDHLNQAGLDHYQHGLRELLAEPSQEHPSPADSSDGGTPWPRRSPPLLSLEAGALASTLAPLEPLNTFSSSDSDQLYLPIREAIEIHIDAQTAPANLLSISYLVTATSAPITIRTSEQRYRLSSATESVAIGKRTARFPLGAMAIQPGDPLIIEPCRQQTVEEQDSLPGDPAMIIPGRIGGASVSQDDPCGLFQLHFDTDMSAAYGRRSATIEASSQAAANPSEAPTLPAAKRATIRLFAVGMWPGYRPATHGSFRNLPGVEVLDAASAAEADAIVVGVFPSCGHLEQQYQTLKATTDLPLIFYTNEHSSEGVLPGIGQLDFNKYHACISHYSVSHPRHIWSPMAVNWFGWNCDHLLLDHQQSSLNSKPWRERISEAVFCYSNDSCEHRNQTAAHLGDLGLLHSCGGLLNNQDGKRAPRDFDAYLRYCSAFRGYMAFENSSFPGYLTEKVLMGIMAGCQTFYWGDSAMNDLFCDQACLNLTGLSPRDGARVIAQHLNVNTTPPHSDQPFKPAFRERLLDGRLALSRILRDLV